MRERSRRSKRESGGRVVLDTSFLIEMLDGGRRDLAELLARYSEVVVPWVTLYEYLYGHRVGRGISDEELSSRKNRVESLGLIAWGDQRILEEALRLDLELRREGEKVPFSDLLICAFALIYDADLGTLDKRHFRFIEDRLIP